MDIGTSDLWVGAQSNTSMNISVGEALDWDWTGEVSSV